MLTTRTPRCRKETARCSVFFAYSKWLFDCYLLLLLSSDVSLHQLPNSRRLPVWCIVHNKTTVTYLFICIHCLKADATIVHLLYKHCMYSPGQNFGCSPWSRWMQREEISLARLMSHEITVIVKRRQLQCCKARLHPWMIPVQAYDRYFLSPIHTADADATQLSSWVASASAVCIG